MDISKGGKRVMSFSSDIKQELSQLNTLANKKQVKYELIGYLLTNNATTLEGKQLRYATESEYNINRFSKLLANLEINHQIEVEGNTFVIKLKTKEIAFIKQISNTKVDKASQAKQPTNIRDIEPTVLKEIEESEENKKAVIRGTFLGSGSINNPENGYHLEIIFASKENREYVRNMLENDFQIHTKELNMQNKKSMYMKDGEEISKFLALMGAHKGMLKFEDIRVQKEMRGKVNRLVNCETANLNKTINAAVEQIEAIKKLQKEKKFNKLDDNLKEIAILRLENPDMSLVELGKKLKNPLGKSGVNYRLKKIIEIANLERK